MKAAAAGVLAALAVLLGLPHAGSSAPRLELSVDSIMRGPKLVGYPPSGLRWSGDSQRLWFEWRQRDEDEAATWVVGRDGSDPRRLSDEARRLVPPPRAAWDAAHRRALAVDRGDVALYDSVAGTRRLVTRTAARESGARFARGETAVSFLRDSQPYLVPLEGGADLLVQLAEVAPPKREPKLSESQRFLKQEEAKLLEAVREASARRQRREEREKQEALPRFELRERQSVTDAQLSADGRHLFLLIEERPEAAKVAEVPNFVTESAFTEDIETRSKVGDPQETTRLAILDLVSGKTAWADSAFAGDEPAPATAASSASAARQPTVEGSPASAAPAAPEKRRPRAVVWSAPRLSKDGSLAVARVTAFDNKDRWWVRVDPASGASRVLDHLRDEAWVREAGFFASDARNGFLPDGRSFYFLSERDGWLHLYVVDASREDARPRQLTSGAFEIDEVELLPDGRRFLIVSNESHPGDRQLYTLAVEGGPRTPLTTSPGSHAGTLSPDGARLAIVRSQSTQPPEVYLADAHPGAPQRQVTRSPSDEWREFPWAEPRLVRFAARDGAQVPARLYLPELLGARPDPARPGVVFVHGAGYLQNAHRYWSSYFREYMFHNLLASRGYVVLDVDYRGSAGYGRDWRTAIYRHMGGKDLDDVVDGGRYLVREHGVDPARLGVYGGSYGGFITLMAMFTAPGSFAAGAALRPVTDWAHYSDSYTSDILNRPPQDAEAYRRSSPIYFAEGLRGRLLICHGMVDTNVHFQDSVRLAQRLVELRKPNWELAAYPVENHGFERETSWADEYRRILKLFEEELRGGAPAGFGAKIGASRPVP
jgi:dipeptidyl aminopeptidase/acylaminoacyl peptidase